VSPTCAVCGGPKQDDAGRPLRCEFCPASLWVHVPGRHRCRRCGELRFGAWLWFEKPGLWTDCLCNTCAEQLMEEADKRIAEAS
jgi:hypothetical protein